MCIKPQAQLQTQSYCTEIVLLPYDKKQDSGVRTAQQNVVQCMASKACETCDSAHIQVYGGGHSSVLHQHHLAMACGNCQSVLNVQQTCKESAALWTMQGIAPWLASDGSLKQQQETCGGKPLRLKMPNTHARQAGPLCVMHMAGIVGAWRM